MHYENLYKRAFDLSAAIMGLIGLAPLLILLALLIKLNSSGPVFYRGVRVGRGGKPFRILKFRTMVQRADEMGGASTPDDDPRVTKIGYILRKYKLDEIPQLFNILSGEMSLVGPRPQIPWAVERYTEEERAILSIRPGITDCASLRFRDEGKILQGSIDPDQEYFNKIHPEKIRLSLEYLHQRSFWLDIKILAQTIVAVAFQQSHYRLDTKIKKKKTPATSQ